MGLLSERAATIEGHDMRTKISSYLPLALVLGLFALASLRAYDSGAVSHAPLGAERVSAELARAVSYGLVGDVAAAVAPVSRHRAAVTGLAEPS